LALYYYFVNKNRAVQINECMESDDDDTLCNKTKIKMKSLSVAD